MAKPATALARELRRRQTEAEVRLWSRVRNRQLGDLKFRRQVPRGPFVADFLCDEAMLIVEVDGSQHDDRLSRDVRRTTYLESLGYVVMRVRNYDLLQNTDRVLDHICSSATAPKGPLIRPFGAPSPQGEKGSLSRRLGV